MKGEKPLSELYRMYKNGELEKKELEGRIFLYLQTNYDRYHVFNKTRSMWEDFLSWFYVRLSKSIDMYRDIGSSFDAYMTSLVHGASREYRSREMEHDFTEGACWEAKAEEMSVHESECEYKKKKKKVSLPDEIKPKQILFLLLKSYYFLTDDFVEKTAAAIGMDSQLIWDMIDRLKVLCSDKESEILSLRERIHCQHYRCMVYQKRLISSPKGSIYHERIENQFLRARKRFYTMKKRLGGIRMTVSNKMIAEVMNVPKGTVDSGLYTIKKKLSSLDIKVVS
jgi:hypothetical protein